MSFKVLFLTCWIVASCYAHPTYAAHVLASLTQEDLAVRFTINPTLASLKRESPSTGVRIPQPPAPQKTTLEFIKGSLARVRPVQWIGASMILMGAVVAERLHTHISHLTPEAFLKLGASHPSYRGEQREIARSRAAIPLQFLSFPGILLTILCS